MAINRIKSSVTPFDIQRELQGIEDQLERRPIDSSTCRRLFKRLESVQGDCARVSSLFTQASRSFVQESEDKIVYLFGKVIDKSVDYEVAEIARESAELEGSSETEAPLEASQKMIFLQKKISSLKDRHRLSRTNLHTIAQAEKRLHDAEDALLKKETPAVRHFDWLAAQKPSLSFVEIENFEEVFPEEVEELFDLAGFVYEGNTRMTRLKYHELSEPLKARFQRHLSELGAEPFEEDMSTIQALFATAYDMADNSLSRYPSAAEIHQFFAERKKIMDEDHPSEYLGPISFR